MTTANIEDIYGTVWNLSELQAIVATNEKVVDMHSTLADHQIVYFNSVYYKNVLINERLAHYSLGG